MKTMKTIGKLRTLKMWIWKRM